MHHVRRLPLQADLWRQGPQDQPDRSPDQPESRSHQAVHGGGLEEVGVYRADLPEHHATGTKYPFWHSLSFHLAAVFFVGNLKTLKRKVH